MRKLKAGQYHNPRLVAQIVDEETDVQIVTANSTALDKTKGVILINGSGGLTGLTLAAPTKNDVGREICIQNIGTGTAGLTITGMLRATQDAITFAAPVDAAAGPSITLRAINAALPSGTASYKWQVKGQAGFVAGTTSIG